MLCVIPDDREYLQNRGLLDDSESLDIDALCREFERQAEEITTEATVRCETPESSQSIKATVIDDITRTIRQVADEVDASVIFIGSENASRVSTPVTSVGSPISEDPRYDVHIVRHE